VETKGKRGLINLVRNAGWYKQALAKAQSFYLDDKLTINLVAPAYFIATKLEAWKGRGNNDLISSHDIEDLINLIDGRLEIVGELNEAEAGLRKYVQKELTILMNDSNCEYVIQSITRGDTQREELIYKRFKLITTS